MIIISASWRNLDYASQAPLHPGYADLIKDIEDRKRLDEHLR
jgi:hypothetical protein